MRVLYGYQEYQNDFMDGKDKREIQMFQQGEIYNVEHKFFKQLFLLKFEKAQFHVQNEIN